MDEVTKQALLEVWSDMNKEVGNRAKERLDLLRSRPDEKRVGYTEWCARFASCDTAMRTTGEFADRIQKIVFLS